MSFRRGGRRAEIAGSGVLRVVESALMTVRAGDAGMDRVESELVRCDGIAGMTAEAELCVHGGELAAHGFLKRLRRQPLVARGDAQSVRRGIKADDALVKLAVLLEDPRLCLCAEAPVNGHRDGAGAVGDFIDALPVVGFNGPGVRTHVKAEKRMAIEDRVCVWQLNRVGHGRFGLHRLAAMATAAGGSAGVALCQSAGAGERERRKKRAAHESQKRCGVIAQAAPPVVPWQGRVCLWFG